MYRAGFSKALKNFENLALWVVGSFTFKISKVSGSAGFFPGGDKNRIQGDKINFYSVFRPLLKFQGR